MNIWLESVIEELKCVTEEQTNLAEPKGEVREGENVVGIACADIRKAYCLAASYRILTFNVVSAKCSNAEEVEKKAREVRHLEGKTRDVLKVLRSFCRAYFPELKDKQEIAIRKGWKVIWREPEYDRREYLMLLLKAERAFSEAGVPDRSKPN